MPSCARSRRSGATGPEIRRRTRKTPNTSTMRCASCWRARAALPETAQRDEREAETDGHELVALDDARFRHHAQDAAPDMRQQGRAAGEEDGVDALGGDT